MGRNAPAPTGETFDQAGLRLLKRPATRLLLVEDDPGDARLVREMLRERHSPDTDIRHVQRMSEAEAHLAESVVDIILLDLRLPDSLGIGAVRRAHAAAPRVPLVVLTGLDDQALAAKALREGAKDYLIKGQVESRGLFRAMHYAMERIQMDEALYLEQERLQVTLESIGEAVASTDIEGNVTFLNVVGKSLTGWAWPDARGRPITDVFRVVDGTSRQAFLDPLEAALREDRTVHLLNALLVKRDGTETPVEAAVSPMHDREGHAIGTVIVLRDVSAARVMARQMTHSAEHDDLTGLPNRLLLNDRISHAVTLAPRHGKRIAILFLDLDGFKHINDSLGHAIGDRLLKSIADRLVGCVRASDTVSRQGGDEFVVLLSETDQWEDVAVVAQRMLAAVAQPLTIDGNEIFVTTSIGVSLYPGDGRDAETLIKNADTAMYQAKEDGRRTYQFFEPAMNVRAVERQSIEGSLRRALDREEFAVHYQPKIDLRTGAIIGAEALIRWHHPSRGMVPPDVFIPIAEECGLIESIGNWVLRSACQQARTWLDAGLPLRTIAVNVSATELWQKGFMGGLTSILDETSIDPTFLELELTEGVLMKNADAAAVVLRDLRETGVQIAIDDFGTGYSSLSYLRAFPIDALKIDQSFVRQIGEVGDDAGIVIAVISMARSLKLRVVAEGVETFEQMTFLQGQDCDEAQGFYFSRPLPADRFERLVRTGLGAGAGLADGV